MPWPVTEKKPWSRQARSMRAGASASRRSMTGTSATDDEATNELASYFA